LVLAPAGLAGHVGTSRALRAHGVDLPRLAAPTEEVPWRGGVVRGVVHDENAWALAGEGGSGHAGLFGTVEGVLRFGCAVLDALHGSGPWRDGGAAVDITWTVTPRPGSSLRAGFDGKSEHGYTSAGARLGPRAFGHLGFTGTSLWIDPDAHVVVCVLTNRVHPRRDHDAIRAARPWAHDALVEAATER
jgi:CubicO group peptidase (beta-lactamase class C family)